jgi:hypothetical protein
VTDEELDEVRRLIVAFENAATWCEQLAALARDSIDALRQKKEVSVGTLAGQIADIDRHLQYLDVNRRAVSRIRTRVGLPAPDGPM